MTHFALPRTAGSPYDVLVNDSFSPSRQAGSKPVNDPTKNYDEKVQGDNTALSLDQLKGAFAEMLGDSADTFASTTGKVSGGKASGDGASTDGASGDGVTQPALPIPRDPKNDNSCEITPRNILEAMLFVGNADNAPLEAQHVASLMRGVTAPEIDTLVIELNKSYMQEGAPYQIVGEAGGYRLALREQYSRTRDKFYGRVREARLSQAAIEVLSIVAYNQPVTTDQVSKFRDAKSGAILSQLVRRQLLRVERFDDQPRIANYSTTDRFLGLFGLDCLGDLPRSEDLDRQ